MNKLTPHDELEQRIKKLQHQMRAGNLDGILIVQRADLFYFSGTAQSGVLFIPPEGMPRLLIRKHLERARRESSLSDVTFLKGWEHLAKVVLSAVKPGGKIGMELDVLPVNLFFRYQKLFPECEIVDISGPVRKLRAVKTVFELEQQKKAASIAAEMFAFAREFIQEGMPEVELAGNLELFLRRLGHQGALRMRGFNQELFYGHVLSGEDAAIPSFFDGPTGGQGLNPSYPQGAGYRQIRRNEPVLVDLVSVYNGYMVDQTRIFCLGKLPAPLDEAYQVALDIKNNLIQLGKPGVSCRELYEQAVRIAHNAGFADNFMGAKEKVKFIGHGIGLELDELPVIAGGNNAPLEQNAVFALEPKFTFPGLGVVGIEDTFVVRSYGLEQLTE